jgi:hypothetical protein
MVTVLQRYGPTGGMLFKRTCGILLLSRPRNSPTPRHIRIGLEGSIYWGGYHLNHSLNGLIFCL